MVRNIEETLNGRFVTGIENLLLGSETWEEICRTPIAERRDIPKFGIQAGFMYSEPNHPFVSRMMEEVYDGGNKSFNNDETFYKHFIIDGLMYIMMRKHYGLMFDDSTQHINDDIVVYKSSVYATSGSMTRDSYLIHWFDQSWNPATSLRGKLRTFVKLNFPVLYRMIKKLKG